MITLKEIIVITVVLCLGLFACAPKVLVPATEPLYEGAIDGAYVSSEDVLATAILVKDCMGLADRPFPYPTIRALSGGNGVQCGDSVKRGCYFPGLIVVPDNVELNVVAHEFVHHYLYLENGDLDAEHKSPYFLKCGSSIIAE